jgi:hemoglobin-like flavoprotein
MNQHQITLVKESWLSVAAIDPVTVGGLFYSRLFAIAPEVRPLFRGEIKEQSGKLLSMLHYVIRKLDRLEDIIDEVKKLGQRHVHYGTGPEQYNVVGSALLWTLEQGLGDGWHDELEAAWAAAYTTLSGAMIGASVYELEA